MTILSHFVILAKQAKNCTDCDMVSVGSSPNQKHKISICGFSSQLTT